MLFGPVLIVLWRLFLTPLSLETFWLVLFLVASVAISALFIYWAVSGYLLSYKLDADRLTIRWGLAHQVIPLDRITGVVIAADYPKMKQWSGVRWPGYAAGRGVVQGVGQVLLYATYHQPGQILYVLTAHTAYGIAPADLAAFRAELEKRFRPSTERATLPVDLADADYDPNTIEFIGPLKMGIWRDWVAVGIIAAALTLNATMFAYCLFYYPSLPDLLPLHFNSGGDVDFIGPRQDIFRLPLAALGLFAVDLMIAVLLYVRERVAAYVALSVGLVVQLMFWVATTRIVY